VKFVNLTPHAIIIRKDGELHIPPSGEVARVTVKSKEVAEIENIPVVEQRYGEIQGLPKPQESTVYIVPTIVLLALKAKNIKRDDVVAPDTSPASAIRNEAGQIIAVRRFQR